VVIGLDDVFDHGAGGFATVFSTFLDEYGDHNFRIAAGGVADKPRIIFKFLLLSEAVARRIADDLGGARFSADFDPRQAHISCRAAFLVDDAVHAVSYFLHRWLGKGESFFADVG